MCTPISARPSEQPLQLRLKGLLRKLTRLRRPWLPRHWLPLQHGRLSGDGRRVDRRGRHGGPVGAGSARKDFFFTVGLYLLGSVVSSVIRPVVGETVSPGT